jgi:hypothetical protein
MKPCLLALFVLFVVNQVVGQPAKPTPTQQTDLSYKQFCDCRALTTGVKGYLPSEEAANKAVSELLTLIRRNSSMQYTDSIVVKAAGCGAPEARSCPTVLTEKKAADVPLILYNKVFMEGVNKKVAFMTRVDRHILAHEISHHVLGHLKNTDGIAVFGGLKGTDAGDTTRIQRRYKVTNIQAEEIQADFFGLWVLSLLDKSLNFEAFVSEFDTDYIRQYLEPDSKYSASHPAFKDRISAMRRFWKQLQLRELQQKGISRGYFANSASVAYLELHPERTFWDLGFVAGLTVAGQPQFSVDGVPVDGLLYRVPNAYNLYLGLQITRFRWQSPWQFEAEVAYSTQKYGTLIGDKPSQRLLETLNLYYLTAFPKATWIPFGRRPNQFAANRFGVFASAGPMVRIPIGFTYQNYGTTVAPANMPSLQLSVNPRASIGVELLKKSFRPGSYKIALSYELARIQLATTPKPKALSHNVDLTFHYSFSRW